MAVFETQTLFNLKLDTNIDCSSATTTDIKYVKPNDTEGTWTATVEDSTKLVYQVQSGDLDDVGLWKFQAVVTIGGRTGYGEIVQQQVDAKL
jgi:hypothetical protein